MRSVSIDKFKNEDEFVVEAMMSDGKFKVIGKVLTDLSLLNDRNLDDVWTFANWGVNTDEKMLASGGAYDGMTVMCNDEIIYVIVDKVVDVVNDNIMVRKHDDVNNGYYIKSARLHKEQRRDVWCYGSMTAIVSEYKSNPFICK